MIASRRHNRISILVESATQNTFRTMSAPITESVKRLASEIAHSVALAMTHRRNPSKSDLLLVNASGDSDC